MKSYYTLQRAAWLLWSYFASYCYIQTFKIFLCHRSIQVVTSMATHLYIIEAAVDRQWWWIGRLLHRLLCSTHQAAQCFECAKPILVTCLYTYTQWRLGAMLAMEDQHSADITMPYNTQLYMLQVIYAHVHAHAHALQLYNRIAKHMAFLKCHFAAGIVAW